MRPLKIAEHAAWTFTEAFLVVLIGSSVFDWGVDLLQAAVAAGGFNVAVLVHQVAEYRRDKLAEKVPYVDPGTPADSADVEVELPPKE